jgi:S-adenosylhomocysteine hydrolase
MSELKYKVKDIALAEWGRKEIELAESRNARINVS